LPAATLHAQTQTPALGQGERADWLRGAWGALWLPERNYNGNIEGVTIDGFLAQISDLQTIDFVQVALTSPNIFSPVHTGPHEILEALWEGDTDSNGDPVNLVVPRASAPDPLLSWLTALDAAGLKSEIYVNSYNLLARNPDGIPDDYPDLSARWEAYCDTDPTVQAFINSHPHLDPDDPPRRKYMFCYAEFILKAYAVRYGDLIDAWCFDSADNIMEACGDEADTGVLDDQRIYEAFANACHAGNPNAAIAFNNSVGTDEAPLATPTFFDDYTFGHPFGGAGNMVVPEILYTRNFAICEFMQEHDGLPFATTDTRDWNDDVVAHFFPKQSTTSWNAGAAPCLTDAQFVEWTAEGCINGGAITWGTPLVRTNLENSPILELRDYALTQLELVDAHFSEFQYPGTPNWRRADTPLPAATSEVAYSHTLTDGIDFWDPAGGAITSVNLVDPPSWLTVAESSPGSGEWVLSGTPTETAATDHAFDIRIMIGAAESLRTVQLHVGESPVMATLNRSIEGGATWSDSGLELSYDNNGSEATHRAISYSTETFQSAGGFRLTAAYTSGSVGNNESHNFSFGLISTDTDPSTYLGLNPFGADTSIYSLGVNLTTNQGVSSRGLNFTNGASMTTLDASGTNVQFSKNVSTPVVLEVRPNGEWQYSINGTLEASGIIPSGFDLSKSYHVVVYAQDDNGTPKSIQSLALESLPETISGLVADWTLDDGSSALVTDASGNGFHGTPSNVSSVAGVTAGALDFNGTTSTVSLPAEAFASISNQITISMWVHGDPTQPLNDAVFQAFDSVGNRVLNIHLPWGNSRVFWDAGAGGTPYNRISKATTPSEFLGRWNHWVFTKNASSGEMKIFLNGSLWHSGLELTKSMEGITLAFLGSGNGAAHYDGMMDEVKLYNTALSDAEVGMIYDDYEGFDSWLSQYPSLDNLGEDSDSDQDGIALLLEYTLDGNPLTSDPVILPTVESPEGNLVFKFTRLAESAGDTEQVFQYSTNLTDWYDLKITGNQAAQVQVGDEIGGCEEVTVTLSNDEAFDGRVFGRLKVLR